MKNNLIAAVAFPLDGGQTNLIYLTAHLIDDHQNGIKYSKIGGLQ
jgi:hypothetical protein